MKKLFKLGFLALAVSVSACSSNQSFQSTSDSIDSVADAATDSVDSAADAAQDSAVR